MKRKIRWLALVMLSLFLLAGFGKKSVELLSDKKLIDLNAAIGICFPGADDMIPEEGDITQTPEQEEPTAKPTATPRPTVTPKPTGTAKPRAVVINVRDREVTCGSSTWEDMAAFKERLAREANSNVTFRLVDDYAEAHVYRQIMAILKELEEEYGISYIMD